MRASLQWRSDGLIEVTCNGKTHIVTEAAFRFDGPAPVMDLSHFMGEIDQQQERPGRTLDDPPPPGEDEET